MVVFIHLIQAFVSLSILMGMVELLVTNFESV